MMEIRFNINKKHAFVVIALLVISGLGIAQVTPNPGHSYSQLEGVAPNCGTGSPISSQSACNVNLRSIVGNNLDQGVGYAGKAAVSDNAGLLDGIDSTGFCQTGGAGCPAIPVVRSTTVYKIPYNYNCQNSAFLCGTGGNAIVGPFVGNHQWIGGAWTYRYWDANGPNWVTANCAWVLCDKSDPAIP